MFQKHYDAITIFVYCCSYFVYYFMNLSCVHGEEGERLSYAAKQTQLCHSD